MISFKLSTPSDLSSDRPCGRSSAFERNSIYLAETACYKLQALHDEKKIGTWKIAKCCGYNVDSGLIKHGKAFVSRRLLASQTDSSMITTGHNIYPFIGPKCSQTSGFGGFGLSRCTTGLFDESTQRLKEGSSIENQNPVLVEKQDPVKLTITDNFSGRRVIGRKYSRTRGKNGPLHFHGRNNRGMVSNIDESLDAAISSVGHKSSLEECNSVLVQLENCSDEKTLMFFKWMKDNGKLKANVNAYNLALRVLSRKEDWSTVAGLLQEMTADSGCKLNFQVFNTLIYVCHKRGLSDWGKKWFHLMMDYGVRPNVATFGMLMNLYQKRNNLIEAEFTFAQMRKCKLNCVSGYSSMITIYTRLGLYDKSEGIINIMKEDKVLPNLENWLVRLNAYSQQGKFEEAKLVLKSMQEERYSPNIVAYNTLITGYGKAGDMNGVQCMLSDLKIAGLQPDETTYRSMIEGFGRASNYEEALKYYEELKCLGFHPNSSNLYTMINLQAKHRDEEGAVQTLKDMRVMGCPYSSMLTTILQAYGRAERVDKVPIILRASIYDKLLLDQTSCSILVTAYVQYCMFDDALEVLREKQWIDQNFEENLYHLLICSCKEAGFHEHGIKIFSQMPQSTQPNLHITCSMIDIFSSLNRFDDAKDLYLKLKASGTTFDMIAYSIVVRMFVKAGSLKDACLVLDNMEIQKDIVPDKFLFFEMLRIYQKCGMLEKLRAVYYKIHKSRIIWDDEMYNCVINCCAGALPVDELSRLFDEMLRCRVKINSFTFNVMLNVYGKANMFKKARKVLWVARKQGLADVVTFNTIIAAYGQNKDFKRMRSAFQDMRFAQLSPSHEAYNSMLDAYGKGDQLTAFIDVLQKMRETGCVYDRYTYNIIMNIYGKKGWIQDVTSALEDLKHGPQPDLVSYNTLIQAYGNSGMVQEAVNVLKEIRENEIEPDRITYINLIAALQKNDHFLEAVKWSLWLKQIELLNSKC